MKGFGWLVIGGLILGALYQCTSEREVPLVKDYCLGGEGTYVGEIINGTPINTGTLFTVVNPDNKNCPFKVVINNQDLNRGVGVGDVVRFKGNQSGQFLAYRDLEINPNDGVGLGPMFASTNVRIQRWVVHQNMNWDRSSWIQLNGGEYGGIRLSFTPRQRNKIERDGCYRLYWNRKYEVVDVKPCSS